MKTSINLRSLDSLRGLLCVYVLAGHARWLLWEGWEVWRLHSHSALATALAAASALLRYGHEAVIVFFVLSGFFIHFRAAGELGEAKTGNTFHVVEFFWRRARRLVPPYVFALLLTVSLDKAGRHLYAPLYLGTTGDSLLDANFGRGGFTASSVVPALCLLPGGAGQTFGSDLPLWSLAYEVIYYLMYPAWLWWRRRVGGVAAYGLGVALGLLGLLAPGLRESFVGQVLAHYPVWLAGAALVELCARRTLPDWSLPVAVVTVITGFAGALWCGHPSGGVIVLYALSGTAAVLFFARLPVRFSESVAGRSTEALGLCSYTIYICHFPMLALASAAVFHAWGQRPANGALALSGALVVTGLCACSFLACERPFLTQRRHRHLRPAPI